MENNTPLLTVDNISKTYGRHDPPALDKVSLTLEPGAILAVIGSSGSGKTTLARCVMALTRPDAGRVLWQGRDLAGLTPKELRRVRPQFQLIFQDPLDSLSPRLTLGQQLGEIVREHGLVPEAEIGGYLAGLCQECGLIGADLNKWPHQFSGGEKQRLTIVRALALQPRLLVADEPLASLDPLLSRQMLDLFLRLREKRNLALLYISHDLTQVERIADRVAVLHQGRLVETAPAERLFSQPGHAYTRYLLSTRLRMGGGLPAGLSTAY